MKIELLSICFCKRLLFKEVIVKKDVFSFSFLNSRISSEIIEKNEQFFGYFLGPGLVYMMLNSVGGTYLIQFYTDVLSISGNILTVMPLISKLISGIMIIVVGRMIDNTQTTQGKARPWLLISGVLLSACGILLYIVPQTDYSVQIAWLLVSYNLFFSLAFPVYSLSHALLVPLSTRNTKQRDKLAMLSATGTAIIPGILVTFVMPLVAKTIGVGIAAQKRWISVMCIFSTAALPAVMTEYYFTKERITAQTTNSAQPVTVSLGCQIKACFQDRYLVMILLCNMIIHLCNAFSNNSMLYYCNWVVANSVDSGAFNQILINVIGQFPMGPGIVMLLHLVRKYGKQNVTVIGFLIASIGSLTVLMSGDNLIGILVGLFIKSFGCLPAYVMTAFLAEALDHIECNYGFRCDGIAVSANSIGQNVITGLSQSIFLLGLNKFGYITPEATSQIIIQPNAIQSFFCWCFAGLPMIGYAAIAILIFFYRTEKGRTSVPEA